MATHQQPASDAGKLFRNQLTPANVGRVAASALAQAPKPINNLPRGERPKPADKLVSRLLKR